MFYSPQVNVIANDEGFSIEVLGRTGIEYKEGDKAMFIDSEILMTKVPTVAIWKDRMQTWKPPHDKEKITEEKRMEILKNICAALKWKNTLVEIHGDATGWVKGWIE
jgi:hypothetical protein